MISRKRADFFASASREKPGSGRRFGNDLIAIVDDEKSLVDMYCRIMERYDKRVSFVAYNGHEALQKFVEGRPRPGIVLMDYRLPGLDGVEVTRQILRVEPDVKVIFISADETVREEAMQAGAATFIRKPARVKQILEAIESVAPKKMLFARMAP